MIDIWYWKEIVVVVWRSVHGYYIKILLVKKELAGYSIIYWWIFASTTWALGLLALSAHQFGSARLWMILFQYQAVSITL